MTADRLARHVAEAADAWLRDPQDTDIYRRLVEATLAWRGHVTPALEGLEDAGQFPDPVALAEAVHQVITDLQHRAAQTELELTGEATDDVGEAHGEQ